MTFTLFSLWMFVLIGRPQDVLLILGYFKPALLLGMLTLASVFFGSSQALLSSALKTPEARKYLLFFGIMVAGIPFAYHHRVAFDYVFSLYLMNVLFFFIFVAVVDSFEKLKKVVMTVSLSMLFYGLFGLLMGSFSDGRFMIYGSMFDPNDVAYVLITLIPFGLFYVVRPVGSVKKLLSLVGITSSLIVILLTGSRAGMLGLMVMLLLVFLTRIGEVKTRYKVGLIAGIIVITAMNHDKINIERYLTLAEMGNDYNVTGQLGRLEVWKKGIELFMGNPLTGVGARCFPMAIGYLRKESDLLPVWQASHNSYLQVAVETGVFGMIVYIAMIASAYHTFVRCRQGVLEGSTRHETEEFRTLAGLVQLSFIGSLFCAFFLSQGYSMFFTLFFSLSAVMRRLAAPIVVADAERLSIYYPGKIGRDQAKGFS